jgi:hypothetical protein
MNAMYYIAFIWARRLVMDGFKASNELPLIPDPGVQE